MPQGRVGTGAIVLLHGVHGNRLSMVKRAQVLHEQGFAVLLIDFQAHGESSGSHITFGRLEGMDAAAAVDFVRRRLPGEKAGLIGISLGGASALLAPRPLPVDALVLESVYPTIDAALRNRLRAGLGPLGPILTPMLEPAFMHLLPPLIEVTPADLRPIDRIGAVTAPILVISGAEDEKTTISEAQDLFAHVQAPKQFWAVPGAGHVDLEAFDSGTYWAVVMPFLSKNLNQSSAAE